MRILMISKACLVGTYQRKLEEIAILPDIDLTVVVPPNWRDERGTLTLERAHTNGYRLEVEPIAFNGSYHWHYYPRLAHRFADLQPDVVHIDEEPYNLATWQALRLARRAGAQALFFTWQNIKRRYPPPHVWMERRVLRQAAYAIAGTQESADMWRSKGYAGKLAVIPQFGVDPNIFKPGQPSTDRPFTIGYVGRLVPEKGIATLFQAVAGLEGAFQVRLVGSGPHKAALTKLAESLSIAERVTFEEQLPSTAMPAIYHQLDALALPSRTGRNWKEQFGRVLIEAMASGVPVVGSDSGAIPEVIGDAGLTFPEGDVQQLRARLRHLMGDRAARQELAERGRQRVLAYFTQAQVAERTVKVYREMVGQR